MTAEQYLARAQAYDARFPTPEPLPRTVIHVEHGTPAYDYFRIPPRVGAPLKCVLRQRMVNAETGALAYRVELTDAQLELMEQALK